MKIGFLFSSMARGGAERMIAHLANTFVQQGDEVSIITMDCSESGYALDSRVNHVKLGVAGKSANIMQGIQRNWKVNRVLKAHIDHECYDVVLSFQIRTAISLLMTHPWHRSFKVIASERANPRAAVRSGKLEKKIQKIFINGVDGFIFQTKQVSYCYSEKLRKKGTVIPNGVFLETLPDIVPFVKRNLKKIVSVGRLTEQKGYDITFRALKSVLKTFPDVQLHIYGAGPCKQKLLVQAEALQINKQVIFHGNVPCAPEEIKDAALFVMSSRFEGMPNALMEAMACGLTCIAADCDFGPGELIRNYENGILVPVEDADALSKAMQELLADSNTSKKLGEEAEKIRLSYNGEKIAAMYHEYIQKVVSIVN